MNVRDTQSRPANMPEVVPIAENGHLIYLYCVSNQTLDIKQIISTGENLFTVCHRNLCAVTGTVDKDEFGEVELKRNITDMIWLKVKAGLHEEIIENVMAHADVIPFKFGTLFNTESSLITMLEQHEREFEAILTKLAHKQEWGLKIYYNREKLKANLENENPEILTIENEVNSSSAGRSFFLRKKIEQITEKSLNKKINECGRECFELLEKISFDASVNRLLPKEVTEREDEMILNSAFLVDKDAAENFHNKINTLKMCYESMGFYLDCTGPWPPYNFCSLSGANKNEQ